ncbi:single myb histone 4 [Anaeramoeba ignava]|uniref:Single myb histone 4 n=1 Tax=Anaeramoeba ignava TaxID=1746090 RepID=A0A9Q0LMN1_ANAIG|nr:single myb histone 4 [Anaeramoeba ignava]
MGNMIINIEQIKFKNYDEYLPFPVSFEKSIQFRKEITQKLIENTRYLRSLQEQTSKTKKQKKKAPNRKKINKTQTRKKKKQTITEKRGKQKPKQKKNRMQKTKNHQIQQKERKIRHKQSQKEKKTYQSRGGTWSMEETYQLIEGVRRYGVGRWSLVRDDPKIRIGSHRTNHDLCNKWRNLTSRSHDEDFKKFITEAINQKHPVVYHGNDSAEITDDDIEKKSDFLDSSFDNQDIKRTKKSNKKNPQNKIDLPNEIFERQIEALEQQQNENLVEQNFVINQNSRQFEKDLIQKNQDQKNNQKLAVDVVFEKENDSQSNFAENFEKKEEEEEEKEKMN